MLQEAYLYRAQEAALKAWAENQQVRKSAEKEQIIKK